MAEAQQLAEALDDALLVPALQLFQRQQKQQLNDELVQNVLKRERDVMRDSFIAGKISANETLLADLREFAQRQLREAKQ